MISTTPFLPTKGKPASFRPQQQPGFNSTQFNQKTLHFSGDSPPITGDLTKNEDFLDNDWKRICDTVVWQKDNKTLTVVDMIGCLSRRNEAYPGYGSVEDIAKAFPGLNKSLLQSAFQSLKEKGHFLGSDEGDGTFWLRPTGLDFIRNCYPGVFGPEERPFVSWHP
jgi:hypothetical protein